jgi:Lsr2
MASDSEIRAWADSRGLDVSSRGRVSQALREAYSAAHNGDAGPPAADYPDGMSDADFDTAEAVTPDDGPDDDDMTEAAPRPVATPKVSSPTIPARLRQPFRRGKPSGKKKTAPKAKPRVSTADLIGSAWRISAKIAQPLPPMYRTLRLQSVIAGPLLDDAVKGTLADTVLQPLARLSRAGETASALLAPNLAIGAMAWHLHQTEGQPNPVVMQACQEMLRHGLMAMMRVGGDAFAQQLAKDQADEERFGGDIDTIMMWILAEPADPVTEEANMAAMAARFAGQPVPEPAAM